MAHENYEDLALKHVEGFISLYGKKAITIKKNDGSKYTNFRKELGTYTTPEVLDLVLDDQEDKSTNLSFKYSILFTSEANANYVKKQFDQPVTYSIIEQEVNALGSKFLVARVEESKLNYEVQCGEKEEKGLFGIKYTDDACVITNIISKVD
jgi:uncharacterized protein Veg